MVLSASPSFFRAPGQGPGQWDDKSLEEWREATLTWLLDEYGSDLVHASIHLDEDTPHIHALIVPTYEKAARKPGKMKRGETPEAFEERKAAAAASVVRTAGRSSCEKWSRPFARRCARQSYHAAVESLGLGYGRDFIEEGAPSPSGQTTAQWVRQRAAELAALGPQIEAQAQAILEAATQDAVQMKLKAEAEAEAIFVQAAAEAKGRAEAFGELAKMFERRTLKPGVDLSPLKPGMPQIKPAAEAMVHAQYHETRRSAELDERTLALDKRLADLKQREVAVAKKEAEVEADLREIREHREWWRSVRDTMASYLERVAGWLRRPDLPAPARKVAEELVGQGDDIERDALARENKLAARIIAMRSREMTPLVTSKKSNDDVEGLGL